MKNLLALSLSLSLAAASCGGVADFHSEPVDAAQALLAKVTMTGPTGTQGATPTATWNAISGVDGYRVWVNDASGNREVAFIDATTAGCGSGTGTCSRTTAVALGSGHAAIWVRAETATPDVGPWSNGQPFTVSTGDPLPESPAGIITNATPDYVWNDTGVGSYQLWVNDSTGNRVNTVVTSAACTGGTCTANPATVLNAGNGKWWVRNAGGLWGSARTFTVATSVSAPATPTATAPTGGSTTFTYGTTFSWSASATATSYELWVKIGGTTVINTTLGGTSFSTTSLSAGSGTWWVRAENDAGASAWSPPATFVMADHGVSDDFSDTTIDPTKWNVVIPPTSPGATVTEGGGTANIFARGYLNSVATFDAVTMAGVAVTGTWSMAGDDFMQVILRSDGIPAGPFGETQNGIQFAATPLDGGSMNITGLGALSVVTVSQAVPISPFETWTFDISDDGVGGLNFTLSSLSEGSFTLNTTTSSGTQSPSLVTFHNREFGNTALLDDVSIETGL